MRWFGESWGAPVCDPAEHVETPVGASCANCTEPIDKDDQGVQMGGVVLAADGENAIRLLSYHLNCHLRDVLGSVGHQLGKCTCFLEPGDETAFDDPPGLTAREAADAAVELFERQGFQPRQSRRR